MWLNGENMDTLIVFCTLVFSASLMSIAWTGIYCLTTRKSRRKQEQRFASLLVNPFEPTDASDLHHDPRMPQRRPALPTSNFDKPIRPAASRRPRRKRLDNRVAPLNMDRSLPVPYVMPRRPALPSGVVTEHPKRLLAC